MRRRSLTLILMVVGSLGTAADQAVLQRTEDIRIRDPFVLPVPDEGYYYLYGTGTPLGELGFDGYRSRDLKHWEGPFPVFRPPADFWGNQLFWAPEVHRHKGKYYLFGTFDRKPGNGGAERGPRGTQICVSDAPGGPFTPIGERAHTPGDWEALDGTLYIDEEDQPWMVFCHEWIQVGDGEMVAVRLKEDLSGTVGETHRLFKAGDAPWVKEIGHGKHRGKVSDGPWFVRTPDGPLLMLWSSFGQDGRYKVGVARSESGNLLGPWAQAPTLLIEDDGGHPMIFETFDGKLLLSFHRPNRHPQERAQFVEVGVEGGGIRLR